MGKIWNSGIQNFRKWGTNPRIYILFLILGGFVHHVMQSLCDVAETLETGITPWLLPFLCSDLYAGLYILLGFVLLFCNAPFVDRHQPYAIIRIGKSRWMAGQMLYIVIASFIYTLSIQIMVIISLLPVLTFEMDWGTFLYTTAQIPIEEAHLLLRIGYDVIVKYTPLNATLLSFLLIWLEGILIGFLLFVFNLQFKRTVGTIVVCFYAMTFWLVKELIDDNPFLWKVMPAVWMDMEALAEGSVFKHPGTVYVLLGFFILITALAIWILGTAKRRTIEVLEQI